MKHSNKLKSFKYSENRHYMHKQILNKLETVVPAPKHGEKPVAILIGGGTASGKTTLRKMIIDRDLIKRGILAVRVDADEIKTFIPEYPLLKKIKTSQAAGLVHKESCHIRDLLLKRLISKQKHFVYEGTMVRTRKYKALINELKKHNYEVHVYVVDVPLNVAKLRAKHRAKITGRHIPSHVLKNTHKLVPRTIEEIKEIVDSYHIYDNQNELNLIASNYYIDSIRYKEFLKKGKINR